MEGLLSLIIKFYYLCKNKECLIETRTIHKVVSQQITAYKLDLHREYVYVHCLFWKRKKRGSAGQMIEIDERVVALATGNSYSRPSALNAQTEQCKELACCAALS